MNTEQRCEIRAALLDLGFKRYYASVDKGDGAYFEDWGRDGASIEINWGPKTPDEPKPGEYTYGDWVRYADGHKPSRKFKVVRPVAGRTINKLGLQEDYWIYSPDDEQVYSMSNKEVFVKTTPPENMR